MSEADAPREPTEAERAAIAAAGENVKARPPRVRVKHESTDASARVRSIGPDHADRGGWSAHLMDTLGTNSHEFAEKAMAWVESSLAPDGLTSERDTNAALALITAIGPDNELEAVLAAHVVGFNALTMNMLHRAAKATDRGARRDYANLASKASARMAEQIAALSRLRSGGKQQVIVKHVYVQGNAVIGDNAQTVIGGGWGGGALESGGQPHGPAEIAGLATEGSAQVRGQEPRRQPLPIASDAGEEAMSVARSVGGRSEGRTQRGVSNGALYTGGGGLPPAVARDDLGGAEHEG